MKGRKSKRRRIRSIRSRGFGMVENKAKHGKVKVCCEMSAWRGTEMVQGIPRQEHERGQIKRARRG